MATLIWIIDLDYDLIEIHHNPNLSKRPYLVRVFNYNNSEPNEIRLDEEEIKKLFEILKVQQKW